MDSTKNAKATKSTAKPKATAKAKATSNATKPKSVKACNNKATKACK